MSGILQLSEFERAVLEKLLSGDHPTLAMLRAQLRVARVVSRELTGGGFFVEFDVPANVPVIAASDFSFGDVSAAVDGLKRGAGFVLFVRDGRLSELEGYSYDEPWPDDVRRFTLSYFQEPRALALPLKTER